MKSKRTAHKSPAPPPLPGYATILSGMVELLDAARRASARAVNALMTATYWEIGRRIVEFEQGGEGRAAYGEEMLKRLSADLGARFGRGFSVDNLERARRFYLVFGALGKSATVSRISVGQTSAGAISATVSRKSGETSDLVPLHHLAKAFPLPWSHYVRLLRLRSAQAAEFYHAEALRGGWSVRQLDRQIGTQFYERTALSRNKERMLTARTRSLPGDAVSADEEIRDPLLLEFLNLKDEYSERDLEEALILHLESFLLELGGEFAFVGRQRRLRIDDAWYRIDLLFFHRGLRCLVIFDLKLGSLAPADIGQMHLYCNYARTHWTRPDENPPVGVILCADKGDSLARYALEGLPNKTLAREYRIALPSEDILAEEIARTRRIIEARMESPDTRRKRR